MFAPRSLLTFCALTLLFSPLSAEAADSDPVSVSFSGVPVFMRVGGTAVKGYLLELTDSSVTYRNLRGVPVEISKSKLNSLISADKPPSISYKPKFESYGDFVARMDEKFGTKNDPQPPGASAPGNTFGETPGAPTIPGFPRTPSFGGPRPGNPGFPTPRTPGFPRTEIDPMPEPVPPASEYNTPFTPDHGIATEPPGMEMPEMETPDYAMPEHNHNPFPQTNPGQAAYTPPTMQPTYQKVCESCNKVVPDHITAGDRCPHCNVYINEDATNGKKSSGGRTGGIIGGILAVMAIGARLFFAIRRWS